MFDVDISKGYVDMPVPEGIDLVSEIERMKREKNAVVLAHYYQSGDLQDIADYVGDPYNMSGFEDNYNWLWGDAS